MNKKILLSLGTVAAIAAPVAGVLSCSATTARDITDKANAKDLVVKFGGRPSEINKDAIKQILTYSRTKFTIKFAKKIKYAFSIGDVDNDYEITYTLTMFSRKASYVLSGAQGETIKKGTYTWVSHSSQDVSKLAENLADIK